MLRIFDKIRLKTRNLKRRLFSPSAVAQSRPRVQRNPRFLVDKCFRLALRNLIEPFGVYKPVRFEGRLLRPGNRDAEHRWTLIRREAEECSAQTLLDRGSAEGYFVQRAAGELGCCSLGIDADVRQLTVAQNINTLERNE